MRVYSCSGRILGRRNEEAFSKVVHLPAERLVGLCPQHVALRRAGRAVVRILQYQRLDGALSVHLCRPFPLYCNGREAVPVPHHDRSKDAVLLDHCNNGLVVSKGLQSENGNGQWVCRQLQARPLARDHRRQYEPVDYVRPFCLHGNCISDLRAGRKKPLQIPAKRIFML